MTTLLALLLPYMGITPSLPVLYEATADKIVAVSPYEKPVNTIEDILEARYFRKKLKPKPFRALYRGGSGVLIRKDGVILTAAHVVRGTSIARIKTRSGNVYRAAVLAVNKDKDLALLKIIPTPLESHPCAKLGRSRGFGWPVYTIGLPQQMPWAITSGIITTIDDDMTIADAFIDHGSSGGGLFDATNGKLVGITIQVYKAYGASVQLKYIIEFLDNNLPLTL